MIDRRTRASLTLVAFVTVLLAIFAGFFIWAAHQPDDSPIEHSNPIANWHLPADGSDPLSGPSTP